jgi:hypothetical protein
MNVAPHSLSKAAVAIAIAGFLLTLPLCPRHSKNVRRSVAGAVREVKACQTRASI